jgi:hypothetical protein
LNQNIVNKLSFTSRGNLISITSSLGGFVAQEVVKGVSGKYTPLLQWVSTSSYLMRESYLMRVELNDINELYIDDKTFSL